MGSGAIEIFVLKDEVRQLMPIGARNFQEWIDGLSFNEFVDYVIICNKEETEEVEDAKLLNMALSIFFKENDIDSMPLVDELLLEILGEFKKSVLKINLARSGKLFIDGPINLKHEVIPNSGVKTFCI